jgi:hypothetical protein
VEPRALSGGRPSLREDRNSAFCIVLHFPITMREESCSSDEFENHAAKGENIGSVVAFGLQYYLRRPVAGGPAGLSSCNEAFGSC